MEADKPPPPTWRERDEEWIRKAFPVATRPALKWEELDPMQRLTVEEYLRVYQEASKLDKQATELERRVKMIVGDAAGIDGLPLELRPFMRIDWRTNSSAGPSWKGVAEALKAGTPWDAALAANTGTPARPFAPRKSKKGDE